MRTHLVALLSAAFVAGCTGLSGKSATGSFSVFFAPYSAELDQQAAEAIHAAAAFAKGRPKEPVILIGYAAPPDPGKDVPGLSDQRATAVKTVLVGDGVAPDRITSVARGVVPPKDNMPDISVRRVDIAIGTLPPE